MNPDGIPRALGWVLIAGSVLFWIGAVTPPYRQWMGVSLEVLQCLDRPHRLAYVLDEIFECAAPEAAAALDIEPATFRKRLQRAREAIDEFTRAHCGLVSDQAPYRCNRRVAVALAEVITSTLDALPN